MRVVCAAMGVLLAMIAASAVAQQSPQKPASAQPAAPQTPGQPPSTTQPAPGQAAAAGQPPAPAQPRTFTAPAGLLLNTVRADRVDDFEQAMAYLQAALASSTNERVRAQAAGWRIFKATETATGGAVLYVFLLDPTVVGADYSLSRILYDAYPDPAKLQEIWKLYSTSVTGGTLLNLTPFKPPVLKEEKAAPPEKP